MAVVYRVPNGKVGDGAGRSRYLLSDMEKVLGIRTNAPLSLSPLPDKSLASEWNRFLKSWQGDYRTTHLIVSFPQLLTENQIEEILEYLDKKLPEYVGDRFHLIVVHREVFNEKSLTPEEILEIREGKREAPEKIDGTAFHIVLSADSEGKLLRLHPRKFKEMKLELSEYLTRKFGNEREKEVLRNFRRGIRTRDPFKRGEIKIRAPEKLEKVKARKLIREITQALENRDIDTAIKIQKRNRMEFVPYKKGQLSPWNKTPLKEDTVYLFMPKDDGSGIFCMQLPKRVRVLWERYQTVFSEVQNELGVIEAEARQDRERSEELRDEIKTLERQRSEIERANRELRAGIRRVAEGSEELERKAFQLGEGIRRRVQQAQNFDGREPEIIELEQAVRTANLITAKDREAQRRDFERVRRELEQLYEAVEYEYGITREELEKEDYRSRNEFEVGNSERRADREENRKLRREDIEVGRQPDDGDRGRERKKKSSLIASNGDSLYKVCGCDGKQDNEFREPCKDRDNRIGKEIERGSECVSGGSQKGNVDYLVRSCTSWNFSCSHPVPEMKEKEEERAWIIDGERMTEEEIKGNPAFFLDCGIKEVRKLALDYLIQEIDEEVEFLEKSGYFRDIEELERLEKEEEIRKEQERERDSGMRLEL